MQSLFDSQFECRHKVVIKPGSHSMKLGISSQELQDFVLTGLELMKNMGSSESAGKANPKLGVKLL